jgi:hypothetical protein
MRLTHHKEYTKITNKTHGEERVVTASTPTMTSSPVYFLRVH